MPRDEPFDQCDAMVIGGGPAGIAVAIYLARACRTVAAFDCRRPGRSDWAQVNHNYLGFPEGISITDLCDRGRQQAERFGARFFDVEVTAIERNGDREHPEFVAHAGGAAIRGRSVVLATGVTDRWPQFPGYEEYIGRSLHWCIVCDGFEMQGQRVAVIGHDDHAAELAVQLLGFAREVVLLTNGAPLEAGPETRAELERHPIRIAAGTIAGAVADAPGACRAIRLDDGEEIAVAHLFSAQGAVPNSRLAADLGVTLTDEGYIKVDTEAKTNLPFVYAAGDVTRLFSHQVLTAAHEGAAAACSLDYALFRLDTAAPRRGCASARKE